MPARSGPHRGARRIAGAAVMLLGAGWLALALPLAGAAVARLPGDAVLRELRAGASVGSADLYRLAESRRAAAWWRDDPRDAADLALATLLLAERAGDGSQARMRAAERALTSALGAAPADPYAWTRLALVRWRLGRPDAAVRAALDAARRTGPQARRLQPVQRALIARLAEMADD